MSGDTQYRGFVVRVAPGATEGSWWWSVLQHGRWMVATDTAPTESKADSAARRWIDGYLRRIGA